MTSFTVSMNCVWLLITGGFSKGFVTGPNTVMIVELGKKNTSYSYISLYIVSLAVHQLLLLIIMDRIIVISKFTCFDRHIFDHIILECNGHFDHWFKILRLFCVSYGVIGDIFDLVS